LMGGCKTTLCEVPLMDLVTTFAGTISPWLPVPWPWSTTTILGWWWRSLTPTSSANTHSTTSTVQVPPQLSRDGFQMHKVTKSRASTLSNFILTAAGLTKVSDGAQFGINWASTKPTVVEFIHGFLSILLTSKLRRAWNINRKYAVGDPN